MFQWWESLSMFSQVLACMAIPATLILLIQTIMMLIGLGSGGDGDVDADVDVEGDLNLNLDVDGDVDVSDGVFGDELPEGDIDPSGFDGLRIFSVRGIVAFFVVFGWVGIALDSAKLSPYVTLPIAFASGFVMMLLIALLFRAIMKLESSGNIDIRNALGVSGTVYLKIPAKREGQGKINVMIQGSYCERDAVTDSEEALPTGSEVVVTGLSGQNTLVVRKK
ncbi:MAG: hypothetical protein J6Q76_08105 [Clostridia bacterium]|nr:hypothetical protein [Clostridia bacterium]